MTVLHNGSYIKITCCRYQHDLRYHYQKQVQLYIYTHVCPVAYTPKKRPSLVAD